MGLSHPVNLLEAPISVIKLRKIAHLRQYYSHYNKRWEMQLAWRYGTAKIQARPCSDELDPVNSDEDLFF